MPLVKKDTLKQAFTPARLSNGNESSYGFGWGIGKRGGHAGLFHGGGWVGFRTGIARYPEEKFTVVVLANRGDANPMREVNEITRLYLPPRSEGQD